MIDWLNSFISVISDQKNNRIIQSKNMTQAIQHKINENTVVYV